MCKNTRIAASVTISSLCLATVARAEDATSSPDFLKSLFDAAVLYKDSSNPYIQKLAFTGRAQFDYALIDGEGAPTKSGVIDDDLDYEEFNTRRLRAGFKATLFKDFTAHVEADFDPDEDPLYQRLTDAYIGWQPCEEFGIKVGKQGMGFTLDGKTSSKELLAIDRSNLTNNLWFTNEYIPGITVGGTINNWLYNAGVFSQGEEDKEFGDFNAGTSWLLSVGYDFSEMMGAKEATLALDYVYNEDTPSSPALFTNRSFDNVVSLNFRYEKEAFGFRSDLSAGNGFGSQQSTWGLSVMPYYNFTDKFQAVFRYTFIESDGDNGVRFARYESEPMGGTKGDQYQEAYLGLNYYIYGQKLKLQTGLQYVSMRDEAHDGGEFDGLSWTTGLRISW
jgi:phosphate-selective porin OprO and OprP